MANENKTIAFPNYIPTKTEEVDFFGGLNATVAPHMLGSNEVQQSTNVDFGLEYGAVTPRRGCQTFAYNTLSGTGSHDWTAIGRAYVVNGPGPWDDTSIPWLALDRHGPAVMGSQGTNTTPFTLATTSNNYISGGGGVQPAITAYGSYIFAANGTVPFRTDGTNVYDWLLPQADTPNVTFYQQGTFSGTGNSAGPFVGWAGTWTATEGTVSTNGTSTYFGPSIVLSTCTATGSRIVVVGTTTTTNWINQVLFITPPTGTTVTQGNGTYSVGGGIDFHQGYPNGDTTGTYTSTATITQILTIGSYGVDYVLLGLSNTQNIVKISRDLSIGDTSFTNMWHAETTIDQLQSAAPDPVALLIASQGTAIFDSFTQAVNDSRINLPSTRRSNRPSLPVSTQRTLGKVTTDVVPTPWAIPRTDYLFIGTLPSPDFTNIKAVRISIEYNTTGVSAVVGGCVTYGAQGWCLTDQTSGIQYCQTFARVENGVIVAEGAPSAPTTAQTTQYAYAGLTVGTVTNTTAGITHRVFYRNGGLLQDFYRVGSCTITASGTAVIYDYNNPDALLLYKPTLTRFIWSQWPAPSAGSLLGGVSCVSEAWQERLWIGVNGYLYWTYPGQPTQVNDATQTLIGDQGDQIQGLIPYTNLVIVKQNSVYELSGSQFEGTNANFTIQKSGSRRGSAAPKTVIKTPYGILLFSYDGISMYRSGYGIDEDLTWVWDKIGDLWKGTASTDPAAQKGRIPALNMSQIWVSCAAYKDDRIYLAVPTGTNTRPDTVFVLDMAHKRVWMYQYPFKVNSLFHDIIFNRLMAGTDQGSIQQLETGLIDQTTGAVNQGIGWSIKTRAWSTPTDVIYENLQVESVGTITTTSTVDNGTSTIGTLTNTSKVWTPTPLSGTIGNRLELSFSGTQSGTQQEVYQLQWDLVPQAPRVTFFETDVIDVPSENYVKTWLAEVDTLGTSTITGTLYINGVINSFGTFTNIQSGRKWFETGLANVTTAKQVQVKYTSTQPFKYYDTTFEFDPKPFEKKTWLVTYKKLGGVTQLDLARFYAMDIEGTLTATITNTWIIDGVAFSTDTFTISAANSGETSGVGRMYADQIPFPPGARGYLFQQQMISAQPFRVWRSHLDIDRVGVKGLTRVTLSGTPQAQE